MDDVTFDEPLIEVFNSLNINAVHRVLERAKVEAARAHRRQMNAIELSRASQLGKALNRIRAAYGRSGRNKTSIRRTAPDILPSF